MKLSIKLSFLLLFSAYTPLSLAAACCGGGVSAPALILGDEKAQATSSYSYSEILNDVGADSVWRKRESKEISEVVRLNVAHVFLDRWQAGASVPVIRRSRSETSASGLGDVPIMLGYEVLPDWDYNPLRPHGIAFLQFIIPSGKSMSESDQPYLLDARGRGYWAFGGGSILTKTWGAWDGYLSFDIHRSLSKHYANSQSEGTLHPGLGGSMAVGGGYSRASWRAGALISWTYEDPVDVSGTISSHGSAERYGTVSLSATRSLLHDWTAALIYTDQRLVGSPSNTSLSRGIVVQLEKRWAR